MMKYDPEKHHRRSIRLKEFDYSSPGYYYVTICVHNRECVLGDIVDGKMVLNKLGKIARDCWRWLEQQYPHVILDEFVIMPNHLHGIIIISYDIHRRGDSRIAPTELTQTTPMRKPKPLGRIIGAYKTVSTKQINQLRNTPGAKFWQRNYYEHIIRNERELWAIRNYIRNNPLKWELDHENPIYGK